MNIVFLTVDDPLYLPSFYKRVLVARSDVAAVFVVPPLYKGQPPRAAALRYFDTFGVRATMALAARVMLAKLRRRSIDHVARRHGVPCERVSDVNDDGFLERLRALDTQLIVSVSCPQLFAAPLIELPSRGCLNIHGAMLPEYRGVLPSFWMLANGETRGGVSIFFVNETIDGGELCGQRSFAIWPDESLDAFVRRSKAEAAELLLEVLASIEEGTVMRTPLDLSVGSYYPWPDRPAVRRFYAAGHSLW
jgi:methionyl-tRNA formyltransferase